MRARKTARKLKTPETEASGVSILMIAQYNRLSRPPATPAANLAAFAAAPSSGCADFRSFGLRLLLPTPARPQADFPGSDRCGFAQLDRWLTSDSHRLLRTSDRPMAIHSACTERPLHRLGRRSAPTHTGFCSFSSAGWTTSGFHRPLSQHQACALRCRNLQLALAVAPFATPAANFRLASAVPPSGFTGFNPPGLRLASLFPAGPLIRP